MYFGLHLKTKAPKSIKRFLLEIGSASENEFSDQTCNQEASQAEITRMNG